MISLLRQSEVRSQSTTVVIINSCKFRAQEFFNTTTHLFFLFDIYQCYAHKDDIIHCYIDIDTSKMFRIVSMEDIKITPRNVYRKQCVDYSISFILIQYKPVIWSFYTLEIITFISGNLTKLQWSRHHLRWSFRHVSRPKSAT